MNFIYQTANEYYLLHIPEKEINTILECPELN